MFFNINNIAHYNLGKEVFIIKTVIMCLLYLLNRTVLKRILSDPLQMRIFDLYCRKQLGIGKCFIIDLGKAPWDNDCCGTKKVM